ncbi:MAG: hypothetical protein ACE141_08760 [Bryobacteraceae bacterium]
MPALLVVLLAFSAAAVAQTGEPPPWAELQSVNPPELDFSLRLADPHIYRRGEVIRAVTSRSGPVIERGDVPSKEFWTYGGLLLDPPASCGSVESPCWGRPTGGFDRSDPLLSFGYRREPLEFVLNASLPSLGPGRYRVALLARKQVRSGSAPQHAPAPPQYAVSNTVEFEVSTAPPEWVRATAAESLSVLKDRESSGRKADEAKRLAAQRLRFLDDPVAWEASLEALPAEQDALLGGLEEASRPELVCELMRSRISLPAQSVPYQYLSVAARVCGQKPPGRALPVAVFNREMRPLAASLATSLPAKRADVKAEAFATLFQYIRQVRFGGEQEAAPPWTAAVRREFIRSFPGLELSRQRYLIELASESIESPELVPFLESILDGWKPGDYYEAPREALLAIHRIDPARARARVLAEVTRSQTWLDVSHLDLLPAKAVAPMDNELTEALAHAQRPGGWNPQLRMAAIAKYATSRVLARMKAIYESQQDPCQPELVAYFVRVDPAYAGRVFHSHAWDMLAAAPPCAVRYFEVTSRLAMAPALEEYLAAYLMHHQVPVKQAAARSLGRYGSPAALKPLWDAFRYFHQYWSGKGEELARNGESVQLEVELRNAIARGNNWLASEADLRLIESLCISGRCRDETREDLNWWREPLRIELRDEPGGVTGAVAHYSRLPTTEAVAAKLAQFPRGSRFTMTARGPRSRQAAGEIRKTAARRGLAVADAR